VALTTTSVGGSGDSWGRGAPRREPAKSSVPPKVAGGTAGLTRLLHPNRPSSFLRLNQRTSIADAPGGQSRRGSRSSDFTGTGLGPPPSRPQGEVKTTVGIDGVG